MEGAKGDGKMLGHVAMDKHPLPMGEIPRTLPQR